MTVYIDQYILINFCMNFVILYITKMITKSKSSAARLMAVSLIGALFSLIVFADGISSVTAALCTFASFFIIIIPIAFKPCGIKDIMLKAAAFYTVSFAAGGCAYMMSNIMNNIGHQNLTAVLIITTVISFMIISFITDIYEKYYKMDKLSHSLVITFNGKSKEMTCYYDTGNDLTDPISKLPVIVTNIKSVRELLPEAVTYELLLETDAVDIYSSYCLELRLRLIPFDSIGGDGIILGFIPDSIMIDNREINAVIGISSNLVATGKSFSAILNPQLII